jgi:hypothetical protein
VRRAASPLRSTDRLFANHGLIKVVLLPDRGYVYESPDHWRLSPDTAEIPCSLAAGPRPNADDPRRF